MHRDYKFFTSLNPKIDLSQELKDINKFLTILFKKK